MDDFDQFISNVLPGLVFSLPVYCCGWFLTRRQLISRTTANWIVYPIGHAVFGFFLFGFAFPNLDPLTRLLVIVLFCAVALAALLLTRRYLGLGL